MIRDDEWPIWVYMRVKEHEINEKRMDKQACCTPTKNPSIFPIHLKILFSNHQGPIVNDQITQWSCHTQATSASVSGPSNERSTSHPARSCRIGLPGRREPLTKIQNAEAKIRRARKVQAWMGGEDGIKIGYEITEERDGGVSARRLGGGRDECALVSSVQAVQTFGIPGF